MLLKPSVDRKLPLDHPKLELGVYHIAHLTDQAQDAFKQNRAYSLFGSITKSIIVGDRTYYRNKVVLTDGGFKPPGWKRKLSIIPTKEQFDLMDIDFSKYSVEKGDTIIRRLDYEISGKPGEEKYVTDTFLNKIYRVNLNSFYQVNTNMAKKVYKAIKTFITPNTIVFDLFAGAATIGIFVSDIVNKVYSIEINTESIKDALENKRINKANNVEIIKADANLWLVENGDILQVHTIILDPARSGISPQSAGIINLSQAKRIIYLSCNIDTQKRDIDLLTSYEVVHVQPYDFFPQTYHIENLVVLDKKPI
ncbi:MAG: class I SAM-dependent RNA methyltransferase [Solitalea-like symbiont of Tyrophagus putrescentiae]